MKGFRLDRPADRWCLGCGLVLVLSLLLSDTVLRAYVALTDAHPFAAGFCKFALLATFGESLAQRMLVGRYLPASCPARWHGAFSVYASRWRS